MLDQSNHHGIGMIHHNMNHVQSKVVCQDILSNLHNGKITNW